MYKCLCHRGPLYPARMGSARLLHCCNYFPQDMASNMLLHLELRTWQLDMHCTGQHRALQNTYLLRTPPTPRPGRGRRSQPHKVLRECDGRASTTRGLLLHYVTWVANTHYIMTAKRTRMQWPTHNSLQAVALPSAYVPPAHGVASRVDGHAAPIGQSTQRSVL